MDTSAQVPTVSGPLEMLEQAVSIGLELGMIGMSVAAASAAAWWHGVEAAAQAIARASASASASASSSEDVLAFGRHAWHLATEPWDAWWPLVRIDMP